MSVVSDQYVTITEGWGGTYPNGMQLSPIHMEQIRIVRLYAKLIYGQLSVSEDLFYRVHLSATGTDCTGLANE